MVKETLNNSCPFSSLTGKDGKIALTTAKQQPIITALYRYPVKGLTPHALNEARLEIGRTLPFDRAYAIENGPGKFDPLAPRHLPKINFLMLMRNERLAALTAHFDDASEELTILRGGKQVAMGALNRTEGRRALEQFFADYMREELRGAPKIVQAADHSFSDVAAKCLHVINLASVRDLERIMGEEINPLRFRANVLLDGVAAWSELDWVGSELSIGAARLNVFKRTKRCAATNVDPITAKRDLSIPAALLEAFGHFDFGIYARVTVGGIVRAGDEVNVPDPA